jgi:RNA polymerase sigma factor (sigma-70 family)
MPNTTSGSSPSIPAFFPGSSTPSRLADLALAIRNRLVQHLRRGELAAHEAEDLAQEKICSLLPRLQQGQLAPDNWDFYLRRVARNAATNHRKQQREIPWDQPPEFEHQAPSPEEQLLQAQRQRRIWQALASLGPNDQELLVLHYLAEVSLDELARGRSRDVVYKRHERAKKRLRARLEQEAA